MRSRLSWSAATGAWVALTLAFRLDPQLETKLRILQLRQDVMRTLNQRRFEGREIRELGSEPVRGRVVRSGHHDELEAQPYVVLRDNQGMEHYARLGLGQSPPKVGHEVMMARTGRGAAQVLSAARRGPELSL